MNDWGSAAFFGIYFDLATNRFGTYGFYNRNRDPNTPISPQDDLEALIKSAFLMLFNLPVPHPDFDKDIDKFWNTFFRQGTIWKEAIQKCEACDYIGLQNLFVKMK